MISLKVIARLLDYPEQVLFDHQQALIEALEPASELDLHHSAQLILFICRLCARPLLDVQADYCELFDRGRATSLLLFEHVHGESRDRGRAMVDLMAQYRAAGLEIDSRELPDFLPLYLEYLASRSAAQARKGCRTSRRSRRCWARACNSAKARMRCCSICCWRCPAARCRHRRWSPVWRKRRATIRRRRWMRCGKRSRSSFSANRAAPPPSRRRTSGASPARWHHSIWT